MLLLVDNYDSFTYNIHQYLSEFGVEIVVIRNNEFTIEEVGDMAPEKIVLSPGPCIPQKAGISTDLVRRFGAEIPTLGICLGHQCIGNAYGGIVGAAGEIMHGKVSSIYHDGLNLFNGLPDPFDAVRYHSLAISPKDMPKELEVSAWTDNGIVMGVRHKTHPVEGIQFHPESIMTKVGKTILGNFLEM